MENIGIDKSYSFIKKKIECINDGNLSSPVPKQSSHSSFLSTIQLREFLTNKVCIIFTNPEH